MAETGASDATLMAVSGHMSRRMLEHYSHVRMAAKRVALDKLESGLMARPSVEEATRSSGRQIEQLRHKSYLNGPCNLLILVVGVQGLEPRTSCV